MLGPLFPEKGNVERLADELHNQRFASYCLRPGKGHHYLYGVKKINIFTKSALSRLRFCAEKYAVTSWAPICFTNHGIWNINPFNKKCARIRRGYNSHFLRWKCRSARRLAALSSALITNPLPGQRYKICCHPDCDKRDLVWFSSSSKRL